MSLKKDFFLLRNRKRLEYTAKEYIDIDTIFKDYNLTFEQLEKSCLFKKDKYMILPNFYHHSLTHSGKKLFKAVDDYKLILLKPHKLDELLLLIKQGNKCHKIKNYTSLTSVILSLLTTIIIVYIIS